MSDPASLGVAAELGGGIAGSAAGAALSPNSGGIPQLTYSTPSFVNQMNNILGSSLQNAIGSSNSYTNQAIAQQNASLGTATNALNSGLTNATNAMTNTSNQGFNQAQALNAPVSNAGYGALDALQDSLGLSRASMGSAALAQNLSTAAQQQPMQQQIQQLGQAQAFNQQAPTMANVPAASTFNPTQQQINQYIDQNTRPLAGQAGYVYMPTQSVGSDITGNAGGMFGHSVASDPGVMANATSGEQQALFQQAQQQAQQTYAQQQQQYQQAQQASSNTQGQQLNILNNYNPNAANIANAYKQGLFSKGSQ